MSENWAPDRGEIIWINFSPQKGREMRDRHPMLILSPKEFNHKSGLVIGLPMTTATYNEGNPFAIKFRGPKEQVSYILAHQPKSLDWRVRQAKTHPWKKVSTDILLSASEILNQIIMI